MKKTVILALCAAMALSLLSGCTPGTSGTTPSTGVPSSAPTQPPIEESYAYSTKNGYYLWPSLVNNWVKRTTLVADTEDGTFFCMTQDHTQADDFIVTQRTLLQFLRGKGVPTGALNYYATDYGDSFSESSDQEAYISFSALRSWQQVLVTLQSLWGDYTDYGYVYTLSNAIAEEMGWETDSTASVEQPALDAFFTANPAAINLLYPSFTIEYASQETVDCCKALSRRLFGKIDWQAALKKPIGSQLDDWYALVSAYAEEISVPFTRQAVGYAYYSQRVPLRIMTNYVRMLVDDNFTQSYIALYGSGAESDEHYSDLYLFFSDYAAIYKTANRINGEITAAVEHFGLEEEAGVIKMNWLSGETSTYLYNKPKKNFYLFATKTAVVTNMTAYLHEYYHHLEHLLNPNLGQCWQSQAFCEIGRSHSYYSLLIIEDMAINTPELAEVFHAYTGRAYQGGVEDYFELYDILSYIYSDFAYDDYNMGRNPINSFLRYLIDLYGESTVSDLMLFPDTVDAVTGKTWDELGAEWEQHLRNKYAGFQIPDWLDQYQS